LGSLILKRANTSRLSGQWSDDDYDVLENGVVVGRIFLSAAAPRNRPWMWASGHNGHIKRVALGYEATREAAMTLGQRPVPLRRVTTQLRCRPLPPNDLRLR
jgi:hypothetical protein